RDAGDQPRHLQEPALQGAGEDARSALPRRFGSRGGTHMPHLSLETLARLVDEAPDAVEAAHVRDCLVCRREMEEMRAQTRALAALPGLRPSPAAWGELERALRTEGLVHDIPRRVRFTDRPALRAAAVLAVFLLGGAASLALWGRGADP